MIIQPSHDATTEPTSKVYETGAEFALQALLMWLNRDKEKFAVEQTGAESGLTIERVEESGLTIERKVETPSLAATPTKLENKTGEDPWFQELNTHPDSQPKPSESTNPNQLEISKVEPPKTEESTRLLYGIKDGKLVNNLSPAEALAVAAMVNGKPGSEIANGANLRIKFNGKIIAETDAKGNLITNEIYGKVPKEDLIEFNHRIAKIAETSAHTPAVAAVAKNLAQAPQTPGKTFLERLFPPFGKKQQTLTPEQEAIKEHLAHSGGKNEYAFKNLPQSDIVFVKTAIAFTEANTSPGNPLISPKGYVVSSELNRDKTVTYQYQTPDGKIAIEATKNPATGMVSIQQCQLTNETRQYLKDLQTTLDRPPVSAKVFSPVEQQIQTPIVVPLTPVTAQPAEISTLASNEPINLNNLKPEQLIKHLDQIESKTEPQQIQPIVITKTQLEDLSDDRSNDLKDIVYASLDKNDKFGSRLEKMKDAADKFITNDEYAALEQFDKTNLAALIQRLESNIKAEQVNLPEFIKYSQENPRALPQDQTDDLKSIQSRSEQLADTKALLTFVRDKYPSENIVNNNLVQPKYTLIAASLSELIVDRQAEINRAISPFDSAWTAETRQENLAQILANPKYEEIQSSAQETVLTVVQTNIERIENNRLVNLENIDSNNLKLAEAQKLADPDEIQSLTQKTDKLTDFAQYHDKELATLIQLKEYVQNPQLKLTENHHQSIGKPIEQELATVAETKAAKAALAKAKREEKKAEKVAEVANKVVAIETKIDRALDLDRSQAKPSTTPNQIQTDTPTLTKKEQLVAQGKATRASKTNTPKAPTKAKTAVKGGRG